MISSTDERVTRMISPIMPVPNAIAGMMPYVLRPEDGSQLKYPDMTRISMMPNQKLGIEMPKKPNIEPKLSAHEFGFAPAQTPSGMPKMIAISRDATASSMVAGSRSPIKLITGSAYRK